MTPGECRDRCSRETEPAVTPLLEKAEASEMRGAQNREAGEDQRGQLDSDLSWANKQEET